MPLFPRTLHLSSGRQNLYGQVGQADTFTQNNQPEKERNAEASYDICWEGNQAQDEIPPRKVENPLKWFCTHWYHSLIQQPALMAVVRSAYRVAVGEDR
jgi:hypothetical protein